MVHFRSISWSRLFWLILCSNFLLLVCFTPIHASAETRIVRVGVYENSPKVLTCESGKPSGIFIDIIEHIAQNENWKLEYVPGNWEEGLKRLSAGKIDLMPDVAYTANRERKYSFHKTPVLYSWFQVYAAKGSGIKSILDLNGKRIAVLEGSVQQEAFHRLIDGFGLKIDLVSLPDYQSTFDTVAKGNADAVITNHYYGLKHFRKFGLEDTAVLFNPSSLYFAAPKNTNNDLLSAIDLHLLDLKKSPQSLYYKSLKRWTSEDVPFAFPLWLKALGIIVGVIMLVSLAGSVILKYQVNARTKALHKSEQKYRELVQHANSIILHWTRDGHITFLNEFGQRFFGYSEEEIIGQHVVGTIVPETESTGRDLRPLMQQIISDPAAFEQNINENMRKNGEKVWISWTNKLYISESSQIEGILSIGTDITKRVKAQEELRRLNAELEQRIIERTADLALEKERAESADRLKSAFLASMSHELRTPLNSIIGFTGIVLQGLPGPLNEEQKKQLGMVQNSARHLLELINDILDLSKIEAGQLEIDMRPFNVRESVKKVIRSLEPMAEKKDTSLTSVIAPEVKKITSDRRRFEQILLNIINNALKFTEEGNVHLECSGNGKELVTRVTDTGIGIKSEDLDKLFQTFQQIDVGLTRNHEGSGLGLSICKKLVEKMGGSISVQSEWDKGSTFAFTLPLEPKQEIK